ncbi:MAG: hypothetical protein Q8L85_03045 [Alphaproteobacteria bacterium]|nr:hypothetical protein [Alphaproteobacteria bacterium]
MVRKILKNFLFVLFILNATFIDALLPDYEYSKNMPIYLKVYIDELAEQQIEGGVKTEETINEFRQQKENKYLPLLAKIKKNKNKAEINFRFDKKFPKNNKGMLLNLVAILLEAEELNEDGVNDFIQPRHDRIVKYRKTECKQYRKQYEQSDKYKESRKKYTQSDKRKEYKKKYYQSDKGKETQKKYYQRKKLLAQQGDQNEQQRLLSKVQSLNDEKVQTLIDASFVPNTPCLFDIPTPQTPSVAQYLLDLYQNGKSSVSFDDAMEDAIYEDDSECEDEILQEDMEFSESIMPGKRKESWCNDNESKKTKIR